LMGGHVRSGMATQSRGHGTRPTALAETQYYEKARLRRQSLALTK